MCFYYHQIIINQNIYNVQENMTNFIFPRQQETSLIALLWYAW